MNQSKKEMENYIWANSRIITQETVSELWEWFWRAEGEGQYICDLDDGICVIQACIW